MKINIIDNELQIICESEKDLELAQDWKNSNIRQYKHNDDIGYVIALDIQSVKLINNEGNKMNDKDQAAIDHVASVSWNPHAAMIVKWLITGWEVEYSDDGKSPWNHTEYPCWHEDNKYRLIEPKPAKPAYRIACLNDSRLEIATNKLVSTEYERDPLFVRWLTDWIEYDPPKKWPTPLVERIAAIDIKAAEWIVDNWDELSTDTYNFNGKYSRDSETLDHMFDWDETDFIFDWVEISKKLGE